jgi:hypothetical protein
MQLSPLPHAPPEAYLLIGTLLGLIPQFVTTYRNWKKSGIEDAEAKARTDRTEAEARSVRIRDDIATGEFVEKALGTMMDATDKLREQNDRINELELDKIELVMRREEVRRMKALLTLNGIPYSDADKFRVK